MHVKHEIGTDPRYEDDNELMRATRIDGRPRMRVYRPDRTRIVLGRGSDPNVELKLDEVTRDRVEVVRRPGGGCAVVLDPGNVIVAVSLPLPGLSETKLWFGRCVSWLVDGLAEMGIAGVSSDGISDLVIGDRKIAGTALYRAKDLLHFGASILVTADLLKIERYLAHPPREPEYRDRRRHLDFVTSLQEAAGVRNAEEFARTLQRTLDINDLMAMGDL